MSITSIIKLSLLAVRILAALASPIEAIGDEVVQTPAGLFPKSKVHAVPEGAKVHQSPREVQIIAANGTVIHSRPYTPSKTASLPGGPPLSSLTTTAQRELQSNWVAYAYWDYSTTATPIAFFGTDWTVPAAPTSWDGQLLYWFNGLQPGGWNEILQPVLQYGISPAGGGNIFAIASWWLVGLEVYHSGIMEVFPGTELQGQMALTGISTSDGVTTYSYSSYFPGYSIPTINASTTHVLSVASEVLEIYNAQTVSDLPSGSTDFTAVDIKFNDNSHMSTIPWTVVNDATDGISMSVISYSGTDGHLRLTY